MSSAPFRCHFRRQARDLLSLFFEETSPRDGASTAGNAFHLGGQGRVRESSHARGIARGLQRERSAPWVPAATGCAFSSDRQRSQCG